MDYEKESPFEEGKIELDENYFGANLVRGKRGREVSGKIPVFGMLKRNRKVIIKNCSLKEILPIIQTKYLPKCLYLLIVLRLLMD